MGSWTEYECGQKTIDGWKMAQRRYDEMSLWDRIFKRPLADVVQDASGSEQKGRIQYAEGDMRGATKPEVERGYRLRNPKNT